MSWGETGENIPKEELSNEGEGYIVTYFKMRGRGEFIKIILEYAGFPYHVKNVSLTAKKDRFTFGQLPVLEKKSDKDYMLAQTPAIVHFLAKKIETVWPKTEEEITFAEQYEIGIYESFNTLYAAVVTKDKNAKKDFLEVQFPLFLKRYNEFLKKNEKENGVNYLVGKKISYVDLQLFARLDMHENKKEFENYSNLLKLYDELKENEKIKKYMKSKRYLIAPKVNLSLMDMGRFIISQLK